MLKEIEKKFDQFSIVDTKNDILKIWPKITGQVTGYFTGGVLTAINREPNSQLIGIVFVFISIVFMILDPFTRYLFIYIEKNFFGAPKLWIKIIDENFNVAYRYFFFMIIQYVNIAVATNRFDQKEFYEEFLTIFLVIFILIFIVALFEYIYDQYPSKLKNKDILEYKIDEIPILVLKNFTNVWSSIYGVVAQFFSTNIFVIVRRTTGSLTVAYTIVGFLFYLVLEAVIRLLLRWKPIKPVNKLWRDILYKLLDFYYAVAIFFLVNWLGAFIEFTGDSGGYTVSAQLVILFLIFYIFYIMMAVITYLTKDLKKYNKIISVLDTTGRIWPKISGTTTGLIAAIISDRILNITDGGVVLFGLISFLLLYTISLPILRTLGEYFDPDLKDPLWKTATDEISEFLTSLGILLIFSSLADVLINNDELTLIETVGITFIIQFTLASFFVYLIEL